MIFCMVVLAAGFARDTPERRLDLKSLNKQTQTEELETPGPELLSLCSSRFAGKTRAKQRNRGCTVGARTPP
jgi:hypothetical protein